MENSPSENEDEEDIESDEDAATEAPNTVREE